MARKTRGKSAQKDGKDNRSVVPSIRAWLQAEPAKNICVSVCNCTLRANKANVLSQ